MNRYSGAFAPIELRAYLYVWKGAFAVAYSVKGAKDLIRAHVRRASRGEKLKLESVLTGEPLIYDSPAGFIADVKI